MKNPFATLLVLLAAATLPATFPSPHADPGTGAQAPLFRPAPGSPLRCASAPSDVAVADVNGDRKPDLIVAEPSVGVAVLLGDGAGGFMRAPAAATRAPADPEVHLLAVGDVDGDRRLDLAFTSHDSSLVGILLGDGQGGFRPAPGSPFAALSAGTPHNHGLVLADVDGDHRLDIVTSNANDASVSVLRGDGRGRFAPHPGSPFRVGRSPYPPALGDLNGDGRLDLVTPDVQGGTLTVLLGSKEGFRAGPGSPIRVTARPYYAALGDLDGDGDLDLVVTHDDVSLVSVLLGDGRGGFHPAQGSPLDAGSRGWHAAIADIDGDGRADLAIGSAGGVIVLRGDATGRFAPAPGSPIPAGRGAWTLALADLNGDGAPDLVTVNAEEGTLTVLMGRARRGRQEPGRRK